MSNDTRRGAYRNYIAPEIAGSSEATVDYLSKVTFGNQVTGSGDIGNKNVISVKKRFIKEDIMAIALDIGDDNVIDAYFRSKLSYKLGVHNLSIGDNNLMDIRTSENPVDIDIGNDNYIDGSFNAGSIVVGDDNILVDFNGIIPGGTKVYPAKKLGSLMFDTRITEYAGEGSQYLTVASTENMEFGGEIKFGSVGAAFVRKNIVSIIGDKVFIDSPLTAKEATYPNAIVFNDSPEITSTYNFTTTGDASMLSKRLPISTEEILALREITIGGTFTTKVFFVRSSDNIAIIKDLLPSDFPSGTSVVAKGHDPYMERYYDVSSIDYENNLCVSEHLEGIHIGRIIKDSSLNEYVVTGFFDSKIVVEDISLMVEGELYSDEILFVAETKGIEATIPYDVSADSIMIPLNSVSDISAGDSISIDGFSEKRTVASVVGNAVELDMSVMPSELNSVVCYGGYMLDKDAGRRDMIADARTNIHEYLFGEN